MKIERLTENKIRIIIDIDELENKNINLNSLAKNTGEAQTLFKSLLKEAKKQVGFVTNDSQLLVEAYSTSEGLFILTFTKFNNESNEKNKKLMFKRKMPKNTSKNIIYKFENFEEFCGFCTYLNKNFNISEHISLFKKTALYESNSKYYLAFSDIDSNSKILKNFYASISEFAKLISSSNVYKLQLNEHANIIFRTNAIKNGIKYFVCN